MLGISWEDRKTNEFVQRGIKVRAGQQENLLGIVKRRKLAWFGHISRHHSLGERVGCPMSSLLTLLLYYYLRAMLELINIHNDTKIDRSVLTFYNFKISVPCGNRKTISSINVGFQRKEALVHLHIFHSRLCETLK